MWHWYDAPLTPITGSSFWLECALLLRSRLQIASWNAYVDKLDDREAEIFDILVDHGYDMRGYYEETLVRPMLTIAQNDPGEQNIEETVRRMLDVIRPVERKHGSSSERRAVGADKMFVDDEENDKLMDDDEELANGVDVLDPDAPIDEGDRLPDTANVFDDSNDAAGLEDPTRVDATGAVWYCGLRFKAEVQELLKEHQLELMCFLVDAWTADRGVLAAHSMGLGKSLSFLAAFDAWAAKHPDARAIVTAPLSMVAVWTEEVFKWESDLTNLVVHTVTSKLDPLTIQRNLRAWKRRGGILVLGHDKFRLIVDDLDVDENTILAVDEAHLLKNPSTQIYQTLSAIKTTKRVFMTGTPLQNHLDEYFAMVQLLSPGLLGVSLSDFKSKYGRSIEQGMLKDSTDEQISKCERAVQVLRWRMADVMHEKSSDLLQEHIPSKVEYRLSHPCDEVQADPSVIVEYHNVQTAARHHKVMAVVALLDCINAIAPNDSVLVFSNRLETLKAIQANRDGYFFSGDLSTERRAKMIDEYNTSGGIMYLTTRSGGVGITLTTANNVIIADPSWNPVDDVQAVSRAWRMGQTKPVQVYRLIAAGTLEERIYRLGVQKHALAARILEETDINRVFTRDDLNNLTEFETCEPIDTNALTQNPILCALAGTYTFYNHDALFLGNNAQLTEAEEISARNDLNGIIAQQPRVLTDSEGELQVVQVGQLRFKTPDGDDGDLVPAYTPYYSKIDGLTIRFSNLGPSYHFEFMFKSSAASDDKYALVPRTDGGDFLDLTLDRRGSFVFRMRSIVQNAADDDIEYGPWSEESVPIEVS